MADQPGTIEVIARELASALEPLKDKLAPDAAPAFLGELGLNLPSGFATASTAISGTAVKAGALAPLIVDLVDAIDAEDAGAIVAAAVPLLGAIADVIDAIAALEPAIDGAVAAAAGLTPAQRAFLEAQAAALPGRLLEWMLLEYIENKSDGVYTALTLLGLIDDSIEPGVAGDSTRPPLRRRALFLDRIVTMLTAPEDYLLRRLQVRRGELQRDGALRPAGDVPRVARPRRRPDHAAVGTTDPRGLRDPALDGHHDQPARVHR